MPGAGDSLRRVRRRVSRSLLREELDRQHDALRDEFRDALRRQAADFQAAVQATAVELGYVHSQLEHLEGVATRPPWAGLLGGPLERLDAYSAAFLNYALGEYGFAAQAGLRFPGDPDLAYTAGSVTVRGMSPSGLETALVIRALAGLPGGARLVMSDAGTTLPLTLAGLGYAVTLVTSAAYPLRHPRLEVAAAVPRDFDAAVALAPDPAFLEESRAAARPGALLVAGGEVPSAAGWTVEEVTRLAQADGAWSAEPLPAGEPVEGRVVVVARASA